MDRFLVTAAIGPCTDLDVTTAELEWIADRRFTATFLPGFLRHADMPPLYDEYWEPFWSSCEELGLALVVHAGFGTEHGVRLSRNSSGFTTTSPRRREAPNPRRSSPMRMRCPTNP